MARPNSMLFFILFFMLFLHPSFSSTSTSKPRALFLPLARLEPEYSTSVVPRHLRSKLPIARVPLYNDLGARGYYTTHVTIGTPPRKYALLVDTGSAVTFVPCSTCKKCGKLHEGPKFDPEQSTTYEPMKCDTDCTCDSNMMQCGYDRQYADMSNSSGVLGTDIIAFSDQSELPPQRVIFGCENVETGSLLRLRADGIMGLGHGELSIVDQLVDRGVISDSFSLCYGGIDVGGGAMVLGGVPPPKDMIFIHSSAVYRSAVYYVQLKEIHVAGKPLSLNPSVFDGKDGTMLDSGTTFAYLPEAAFIEFKQAMMNELHSLKKIRGPNHPGHSDICFSGPGSDISDLSTYFPTLDIVFEREVKLSLSPENYLFRHPGVHGGYCLGIYQNPKDSSTVLGGIVVRNTFVTYDRENEKIGFWKTDCADIWERLNATGAPPPGPSTLERPKSSASLPPAANPTAASPYVTLGIPRVGRITFYMFFNVTYSIIKPHMKELAWNIAEELDLHASQVRVINYISEGSDSLIRLAISPAGSDEYISNTTARSIISRLAEHRIHLPEIFGSYQFSKWKADPPSKRTWRKQHYTTAALMIIVTLLLGLLISATSLMWKRKWRTVVPYKPFRSAVLEQELRRL
ncbi:Aspartic proteinase-like protein 2 [Heracleum sosnowskyi]|uniref:Aspartic proteinase-like protein 2 n=1 Tax=Heracleum sosnowskyi TaxID=360622 RepID=A0AAD8MSD2_9APIA|nr:Aspartic proteinase-like protein 2 [Heracleum sosnowskyi]